jgi:PhzF family phenazine biosynthesis protein
MTTVDVHVVRVFTDPSGAHGNPLGIVDGRLVPSESRQPLAAALGYSETVFIDDPAAGVLQIFTPLAELPFAGHPTVGTAWWLHSQGHPVDVLRIPAGEIAVTREDGLTSVRDGTRLENLYLGRYPGPNLLPLATSPRLTRLVTKDRPRLTSLQGLRI